MAFKDNLKKIREFRRLKAADITRGTGIKKQQYSAWEKGDYEAGNENLDLLACYLDVPRNFFFKETLTTKDLMEVNKSHDADDWYKQTISSLIHSNNEALRINNETIIEFRIRDKDEIQTLRVDKDKLLEVLVSHFKPPQNGQ